MPPAALPNSPRRTIPAHIAILLLFWLAIFCASLTQPPLLDDADATHAQAAQAMLHTHDFVTLHVDGMRYLEKPPLPYWLAAASLHIFGETAFAIHLPLALTVLALAFLGYLWASRAFTPRTAFYTALFLLTSLGTFLFTRVFIPDALLSLLLALTLYTFLRALDQTNTPGGPFMRRILAHEWGALYPYLGWTALALAVLTKGLVAPLFIFTTLILYLSLTGDKRRLYRLRPFSGFLLFLAIAAPWHILAGLRNKGGANGHGFFWFYFVNEHVLRFLGRRIPADYNKLPATLYWTLHLVWLFPWSLFAPAAILIALRIRRQRTAARDLDATGQLRSRLDLIQRKNQPTEHTFTTRTILLLATFSAIVLLFFAFSTNQEYYTFPVYLPFLMLLAAAIAHSETTPPTSFIRYAFTFAYAAFVVIGLAAALILTRGLWLSRHVNNADIGDLLAHRDVANYTLSLSHFFDLTTSSFAALRLPAAVAAIALTLGPILTFLLRKRSFASILTIATTSATFLIAAHIALIRFAPMLSSKNFADTIQTLERTHQISPDTQVLIYGDQAFGSSLPFYLDRPVLLVDGRSTSMLFGSTFPDAPPIFLTPNQLAAQWGTGPRKLLFVPLDQRSTVTRLLGPRAITLSESSGKALLTDRPPTTVDTIPESPGR
ncbi:MAG: glycosyltransferase family 39 protein [Acidobacteriota bacterium]